MNDFLTLLGGHPQITPTPSDLKDATMSAKTPTMSAKNADHEDQERRP